MSDETLHVAFQNWETLSGTPEEILAYQARLKRVIDEEAFAREMELQKQEAEHIRQEAEHIKREAEQTIQKAEKTKQMAEKTKQEAERIKYEAEQQVQEAERRALEAELSAKEAAAKSKMHTVQHLLALGIDVKKIAEATELNVEQILKIQRQLSND